MDIFCETPFIMDSFCYKWSINTPGTAGGPGGRDRTLAVKSRKNA